MPLPSPPFTYDDPRLVYDEHCFLYDGDDTGYSELCLNPPTQSIRRRGGGSHHYTSRNSYPTRSNDFDVLFKTHLLGVNSQSLSSESKYLRYKDVLGGGPRVRAFEVKTLSTPKKELSIVVSVTPVTMGSVLQEEIEPIVKASSQIIIRSQPRQAFVEEATFLSQSFSFDDSKNALSVKATIINVSATGSFE